ncbi:MAG TPA: sn-glycerol-3-phosphate ABC transporter ATP-binding protein UgpC [Acidimicrobiales bacterium]|jgi:multiple sugar transport system ATP-binding protein
MAKIELDHVTKQFLDGTEAVHDTTFEIDDGEFFILVGPSGCGKSTLLNMIVGLEDVSGGEVKVDGKRVNDVDPKDRNMAMVFQSYAIYPHMTVRENIAFPLKLAKVPKEEIAKRVDEAAATLELTELLDRKPAQLSGGQRQRVAMGRAIVREPNAFLMDEPLSNLDAKLRVQMRTEIAQLQDRLGITTIYVTHDQTEAMTLGDRIAVLRKGVVQQVGSPRDLYTEPANVFVAGFIGSPAMNLLPATVEGDHLKLPMVDVPLDDALRSRLGDHQGDVVVGVRPEAFSTTDTAAASADGDGHVRFTAKAAVVEWMGAEQFAYFDLDRETTGQLDELADELGTSDSGGADRAKLVARLDQDAEIRAGHDTELLLDPSMIHVFDCESGDRLDAAIDLRERADDRDEAPEPAA